MVSFCTYIVLFSLIPTDLCLLTHLLPSDLCPFARVIYNVPINEREKVEGVKGRGREHIDVKRRKPCSMRPNASGMTGQASDIL